MTLIVCSVTLPPHALSLFCVTESEQTALLVSSLGIAAAHLNLSFAVAQSDSGFMRPSASPLCKRTRTQSRAEVGSAHRLQSLHSCLSTFPQPKLLSGGRPTPFGLVKALCFSCWPRLTLESSFGGSHLTFSDSGYCIFMSPGGNNLNAKLSTVKITDLMFNVKVCREIPLKA